MIEQACKACVLHVHVTVLLILIMNIIFRLKI